MRVLYIGGTGEVSYGCIQASIELGHETFVFNRGTSGVTLPAGARHIAGDVTEPASYAALGRQSWDAVCQFRTFSVADAERDVETFAGATQQFVYISTASAYEKPPRSHRITEATPLANPFSEYSRNKALAEGNADFTVGEVAGMTLAVADALPEGEPLQQVALLVVAKSLMDCLQEGILGPQQPAARKRRPAKQTALPFQFKITLLDVQPAVWRRIQAVDCTLGALHTYLQAALGWENCHLHLFEISGVRYGPLAHDDLDMEVEDESKTLLSQLLPAADQRTRWVYEYDFGDGWRHEVLFEGRPSLDRKTTYPVCLEGGTRVPPGGLRRTLGLRRLPGRLGRPQARTASGPVGVAGAVHPGNL